LGIVDFNEVSPIERREIFKLVAPIMRAFSTVQAL
jgi:hypothetical protein